MWRHADTTQTDAALTEGIDRICAVLCALFGTLFGRFPSNAAFTGRQLGSPEQEYGADRTRHDGDI